MKKPSRRMCEWNRIHARLSNKRRLASKLKLKAPRERRLGAQRPKQLVRGRRVTVEIKCPEDFSLETNFSGVVSTLRQIRDHGSRVRNQGIYIDFRQIRVLSPAAALVLAAELDRWSNIMFRSRLRAIDVHEWDPEVRSLLADMGFFDLLEVEDAALPGPPRDVDTRYVKFRRGRTAEGEAIDRLRSLDLEPAVGQLPDRIRL